MNAEYPAPPTTGSLLLVGEDNPQGNEALHPEPANGAGARLMGILGLGRDAYAKLARRNLCGLFWDDAAAASTARVLLEEKHRTVVMLGRKVARAFERATKRRAPHPFAWTYWWAGSEDEERAKAVREGAAQITRDELTMLLALPHPSGRCREWNDSRLLHLARYLLSDAGLPVGASLPMTWRPVA